MTAVEIEEAISALAEQPFEATEFPFAFLAAFGNKETTIKRLRSRDGNYSDCGGVLQRHNAHIAVAPEGDVGKVLAALKASSATAKHKVQFVIATDGAWFEAEDVESGETVASKYADIPNHFGFFLPLGGISPVRQVRENSIDIRATSRLNRLYIELLKGNPDWGTAERRHDMNHFMARLIFCFFAEDTGIFTEGLFTRTVEQMSAKDSFNTHEVIATLFRAMDTKRELRKKAGLPRWTEGFPYVNGGLFAGGSSVPSFSRAARSYLLHVGSLDWTQINPDIFGSMIQAVADEDERGALGMHYTSRPNILKVLNPLFLDELRAKLAEAGDNARKLLNLRTRIARIRVFDPACGSGNFLVIAYKEMRAIEAEINRLRGEENRKSEIPLTNFRGLELRDFAAEIARLSLIVGEFQCDVLYRGKQLALAEFLPLQKDNWIVRGNALRIDWLSVCPPTGTGVKLQGDDLFATPLEQAEIDFENEGGETYICGNPQFKGAREQSNQQKEDMRGIFDHRVAGWRSLDYVSAWFMKAADYGAMTKSRAAFVATNSICQGQHVPILWPHLLATGHEIAFAHTSFKWANLARYNAGVSVVVVGIATECPKVRRLFSISDDGVAVMKEALNINPYLAPGSNLIVFKRSQPLNGLCQMSYGNYPGDGTHLTLNASEAFALITRRPDLKYLVRPLYGAQEFIKGLSRFCLWIDDSDLKAAMTDGVIAAKIDAVRRHRLSSGDASLVKLATRPHQYRDRNIASSHLILVPTVSSEQRDYIPPDLKTAECVTTNQAFALYDAPLFTFGLVASRVHLVWVAAVCGKHENRYRYSNTLGWNTFPVPTLTDKNKSDLARCAADILLAREAHFPDTIADMYDPYRMPGNLRAAHDRNDEVVERIYVGRRFKNDTERLSKLFELYGKLRNTEGSPEGKASA